MLHDVIKCRGHHLLIRCNPVCNFLKLLFYNFVQPDSVETWAKVAKLSKLKTKKLEICANRCIAADLSQIEHIRSIELLQISGQLVHLYLCCICICALIFVYLCIHV